MAREPRNRRDRRERQHPVLDGTVDIQIRHERRIAPPTFSPAMLRDIHPDDPIEFEYHGVAMFRIRAPWRCRSCECPNTHTYEGEVRMPGPREMMIHSGARCDECGQRAELDIRINLDARTVHAYVNPPIGAPRLGESIVPSMTRDGRGEGIAETRCVTVYLPTHPAAISYRNSMIGVTADGRAAPLGLIPGMRYMGLAVRGVGPDAETVGVSVGMIVVRRPAFVGIPAGAPSAPPAMTPLFCPSDNIADITTIRGATCHTVAPAGMHRVGIYLRWARETACHEMALMPDGGTPNGNRAIAESIFAHYENLTPGEIAANMIRE